MLSTPKDTPRDNHFLHFVGAFINLADLAVAINSLQRVLLSIVSQLLDKAITATHLDRIASQVAGETAAYQSLGSGVGLTT